MRAIEDIDWSTLEDAYGPAVEVPHQVGALVSADVDEARRGLDSLGAGIFHQGSYYSATAPAVPFVVDAVANAAPAVKAEIALFLADMAGVHPAPRLAYEPWVFHSTPGAPDYPEAIAAVDAVRAARETFTGWLTAPEVSLRSVAVFLTSGLDAGVADALAGRLAVEEEPAVRATLLFALTGLGRPVDDAAKGDLEAELLAAARSLHGRALDGDVARLESLSARASEERTRLPFFGGDLCALACAAMLALAQSHEDEVFAAARRALTLRLDRGERMPGPPESRLPRLSDPEPAAPPPAWDPRAGAALGALGSTLARIAFQGALGDPTPLRREALDERQRAVLSLTADHGVPVPVRGAPWVTASSMRRFLTGGGALDRELTIDGVTAAVVHHLLPRGNYYEENLARVERVGRALSPEECLDVLEDVLAGGYDVDGGGVIGGHLVARLLTFIEPHLDALAPRLDAYAERCAARMDEATPDEARLALGRHERDRRATPEAWDPLVALSVIADPEGRNDWLRAFPPMRRARIACWSGNGWVCGELSAVCDPGDLEAAIVDRFVDPACDWLTEDVASMLSRIESVDRLREARSRTTGLRAKLLDTALRERTGEGHYVLHLAPAADAIEAVLSDAGGRELSRGQIPAAPRAPDLEPAVAPIGDRPGAVVSLAGELDRTTRYTIQRHLAELGVGEIRDGGTTLRRR